jgi:hypothetical protein
MSEAPSDKAVGAKRVLPRRMNKSDSRGDLSRPVATNHSPATSPLRKIGGTGNGGNKENDDDDNILQSPTPYWKVASERGTVSPRETRAAKKRKTTDKDGGGLALSFDAAESKGQSSNQQKGSGLMVFSPPDQMANAKREKLELEEKTRARYVIN